MISVSNIKNFLIRHWAVILIILVSVFAVWSLFLPGYFKHHDDLQVMRIYEMDKCFRDFQIPCRWVPDMGYGYGYPLFNYYPVMPYYLGEFIHAFGISIIWSVKLDFALSLIMSALTMYLLGKALWGKFGGIASSLLYLFAPYHSVDVFVRGAMAESWSMAWVPLVFWSIYKLIMEGGRKNIMFLAISTGLLLTSHNPLALLFSPILIFWALILVIYTKKWKSILNLAIGGFWGLGLSAFFMLTVVLESQYVHIETLTSGYFNYLAHFANLNQLFISRYWGYGGSIWGPNDTMSFQVGWLHWGGVLLTVPAILYFWKKDRLKSLMLLFLFLAFWFATFLIHQKSNFIWERLYILQQIQFPWRILSVVILISSIAIGSLFSFKVKNQFSLILLGALIIGIFVLYQGYFKIEAPVPLTDQEKLSGALWNLERTSGIFDYLPKTAKFPPGGPALETIEVKKGSAQISDFKKGTNWLSFSSESTKSAKLRLPIIDFPNWKLFVDGKEITFYINNSYDNDLGQPTFEIASGKHTVFAKLFDTPVRTISNLFSLISFIVLANFLLKLKKL